MTQPDPPARGEASGAGQKVTRLHIVAADSALIQTAHEQLDLDAGDVTYTIQQWVVPGQMLRLAVGTPVQIAVKARRSF